MVPRRSPVQQSFLRVDATGVVDPEIPRELLFGNSGGSSPHTLPPIPP
jgi:hypothetical protein